MYAKWTPRFAYGDSLALEFQATLPMAPWEHATITIGGYRESGNFTRASYALPTRARDLYLNLRLFEQQRRRFEAMIETVQVVGIPWTVWLDSATLAHENAIVLIEPQAGEDTGARWIRDERYRDMGMYRIRIRHVVASEPWDLAYYGLEEDPFA